MKIIIPARKGSKGLPFKNRKLFARTHDLILKCWHEILGSKSDVIVATDDEEIQRMAESAGFTWIDRPDSVSNDRASTKSLIQYVVSELDLRSEILMVLYLTYPERTVDDIMQAISLFVSGPNQSLLCKKEIDWTPFLVLKEEPGGRGSQLFHHDLYRRQDYPKCFELSHYICILKSDSINKLNNNLYNIDTVYYPIDPKTVDVDTQKDLDLIEDE